MNIRKNTIISGFSIATINSADETQINFVTDQFLSMLEVTREEYIANPYIWTSMVSPDDRNKIMQGLEISKKNGSRSYWEGIFYLNKGTKWYSSETFFRKEHDGKTICESVIIDITDYKEFEQLILENQTIYEKILSKTSQGFWISGLDGRIIEVNDAYCKMTGFRREEIIGMHVINLDIFYTPEEISSKINELTENGSLNFGTLHRDKYGNELPVLVSSNYNASIPDRIFTFFYDLRNQADANMIRNTVYDIEKSMERRIKEAESLMINMSEQALQLIGQELHDNIGQILYAAFLQTSALSEKLRTSSPEDCAELDNIKNLLKQSIKDTRNISNGLYPVGLDKAGLIPMIENFLNTVSTMTKISTHFTADSVLSSINPEKKLHIFRIIQEAVSNSVRHAKASNIYVNMGFAEDKLTVRIADDGIGIDNQLPKERVGLGLFTMRSRSNLINADLSLSTIKPHGTQVLLTLKLSDP